MSAHQSEPRTSASDRATSVKTTQRIRPTTKHHRSPVNVPRCLVPAPKRPVKKPCLPQLKHGRLFANSNFLIATGCEKAQASIAAGNDIPCESSLIFVDPIGQILAAPLQEFSPVDLSDARFLVCGPSGIGSAQVIEDDPMLNCSQPLTALPCNANLVFCDSGRLASAPIMQDSQLVCASDRLLFCGSSGIAAAPLRPANGIDCDADRLVICNSSGLATAPIRPTTTLPCDARFLFCGTEGMTDAAIACGSQSAVPAVGTFTTSQLALIGGIPTLLPPGYSQYWELRVQTNTDAFVSNAVFDGTCVDTVCVLVAYQPSPTPNPTSIDPLLLCVLDTPMLFPTTDVLYAPSVDYSTRQGFRYLWKSIPIPPAYRTANLALALTVPSNGQQPVYFVGAVQLKRSFDQTTPGVYCGATGLTLGNSTFPSIQDQLGSLPNCVISFSEDFSPCLKSHLVWPCCDPAAVPCWETRDLVCYTALDGVPILTTTATLKWDTANTAESFQCASNFAFLTGSYTVPVPAIYKILVSIIIGTNSAIPEDPGFLDALVSIKNGMFTLTQKPVRFYHTRQIFEVTLPWMGRLTAGEIVQGVVDFVPSTSNFVNNRTIMIEQL